ncbi:TAXI family TRAP transporter solute-binding subunit [Futiania mangrovi]|uniref:TAXI family TRAP transporter solute-binding subunit n=1 Tax=Futiania mangrovi TaxID=2959716 RepID=A0A9J6PIY4_9PROT|nr:TAXI family TRAP transporter solute-binding subunit [Futiania mangrovii]MCP1337747.1 TAXI family TRAP transporter solute-binding subunit [Futiania mangrovii]
MKRMKTVASAVLMLAAGALAGTAQAELPKSMTWTAYDVGSSGYVEASAMADALMKEESTRVRIMPSGTSIGRLLPLKTGRAAYGWLANEIYFAAEAIHDFAAQEWGPQDLRVMLGRPAGFGLGVAGDAGVKTLADLKGKRIARVQANPSVNIKVEAILAFAGLTWDDVEVVDVPSYGASLRALVEGTADAAGGVPTAATFRELEASPRGIVWPSLPDDDKAGWDRVKKVGSFFAPITETVGAGLSEDNPAQLIGYRYPMIATYADTSADEVYAVTKAIVETYDLYKDVNKIMPRWQAKIAGHPPADAPFHEGAVRYLKEIGVWTAEDEAWNQDRLARMKAVQAAWDAAMDEALEKNLPGKDWEAFWADYRAKNLQ